MNLIIVIFLFVLCGLALVGMKQVLQNNSYPVNGLFNINDYGNFLDLILKSANNKNKYLYSLVLLFSCLGPILILGLILSGIQIPQTDTCKFYRKFLSNHIEGVVVNKFINESNRGSKTLTLNFQGKEVTGPDIGHFSPEAFDYIQIGDTILKEAQSPFIQVINNERSREFKSIPMGCEASEIPNTASAQNSYSLLIALTDSELPTK